MSRASERMIRDAQKIRTTLNGLSDAVLTDLVRRAGNRATTEWTDGEKGVRGKGHYSDPTQNAVVKKLSKGNASDPVWDSVQQIALILNDIAALTQSIDQRVRFVTEGPERAKESTIVHCQACGREVAGTPKDRVRSGYCMTDYQAWLRAGRPYRSAFEQKIREKLSETSENR
jgi:hypothetical protein